MSRPLRILFGDAVYHVMNRGTARQMTFVDDDDYQAFLNTLGEAHRLCAYSVQFGQGFRSIAATYSGPLRPGSERSDAGVFLLA